jgi:hypothetical protein
MAAINQQTLETVLRLRDEISSQLAKPKQAIAGMSEQFKLLGSAAKKAFGIVSATMIVMGKSALSTADDLTKLSAQTGVSVESLQKLSFAAAESGASLEDIGGGLRFLNRSLNEARGGSSEAIEAFHQLGVGLRDIEDPSLNAEKALLKIADALEGMSQTERAGALKVLGRGASELIPLLSQGSAAIVALGEAAKSTGAIMSTEAVQALDTFGDQVSAMGTAVKGMWGEVLGSQAVSIPAILDGIGEFAKVVNGIKGTFVLAFKTIVGALAFSAAVIKATFKALVDFIAISIAKVVSSIATPLLKLSKLLEENGLYDPFKGMRASLEGWVKSADKSLTDPFVNLGSKIRQEFEVAKLAQGEFVKDAQADYKAAADSVDIFIGRLKTAAELQTEQGRAKVTGAKRPDAGKALDSILDFAAELDRNWGLTTEKAQAQEFRETLQSFTRETGIQVSAEQAQQLANAFGRSREEARAMFEEIQKATEGDPLSGLQLAMRDLAKMTFNWRTAIGGVFDELKHGISEALADAIDGSQKFSDSFKKVAKDLKRSLIKMFTDFATNQVFGGMTGGLLGMFGLGGTAGAAAVPGANGGAGQAGQGAAGTGGVNLQSLGSGLSGLVSGEGTSALAGLGVAGAAIGIGGVKSGNMGPSIGGMAMAGLSIGAMAGPIGAVAGLAIGAIAGAIMGSSAKRRRKRAQRRAAYYAALQYQAALDKARVVLKQDLRNKLGGGLADQGAASEIGQLFSGDLSASEIESFGSPEAIAARANEVNRQSTVNVGGITVHATVAGSYDVARLAEELSYHLQNQAGTAGGP